MNFLRQLADPNRRALLDRLARGMRGEGQVDELLRLSLAGDTGQLRAKLGMAGDDLAKTLPVNQADQIIADSVSVVAHADGLGFAVKNWTQSAITGVARYLDETGWAARLKEVGESISRGIKEQRWHPDVMQEFLKAVNCVPKGTKGSKQFLTNIKSVNLRTPSPS